MITTMAMLMLLAQAGGGGGGSRPTATPVGSPASWFSEDDYPIDARMKGEEGRVAFFVDVDATGAPTACHVVTSSGSNALDNGACAVVMQKGRFKPAHDAAGKAVASTWSSATRWALPESMPIDLSRGPVQQFAAVIEVSLDAEGKITGCKTTPALPAGSDPCASYAVGNQAYAPTVKDGKPVAAVMTLTTNVIIRAAD